MNKSLLYIVGGTVLVGGAYLFLKNKKAKDLSKLAEIGGTTPSWTTPSGTTPTGTTPSGTTPSITEPVKIDKDLNLNAYNLQKVLEELKEFDNMVKTKTVKDSWTGQIKLRYTNITEINKLTNFGINKELIVNELKNSSRWCSQFRFIKTPAHRSASWMLLPIILDIKYKDKKKKFINYLENQGIETRPIISGSFNNQPAAKLYNLFKDMMNYKVLRIFNL